MCLDLDQWEFTWGTLRVPGLPSSYTWNDGDEQHVLSPNLSSLPRSTYACVLTLRRGIRIKYISLFNPPRWPPPSLVKGKRSTTWKVWYLLVPELYQRRSRSLFDLDSKGDRQALLYSGNFSIDVVRTFLKGQFFYWFQSTGIIPRLEKEGQSILVTCYTHRKETTLRTDVGSL